MRDTILPVLEGLGLQLEERDVHDDPSWERLYLFDIPVLLLDGREVARHRITPDGLRSRLTRIIHEAERSSE